MARLSDPVTCLKGVGPAKAKQLAQLNIRTLRDLICHFPRGYEDRTKLVTVSQLQPDVPACFRAMVMNTPRTTHIRKGLDLTKVQVADSTGRLNLTFFNQKYATEHLIYGEEYIFYGAVSGDFIGYNMTSPCFEPEGSLEEVLSQLTDRAEEEGYLKEGGKVALALDAENYDWVVTHGEALRSALEDHVDDSVRVVLGPDWAHGDTDLPPEEPPVVVEDDDDDDDEDDFDDDDDLDDDEDDSDDEDDDEDDEDECDEDHRHGGNCRRD